MCVRKKNVLKNILENQIFDVINYILFGLFAFACIYPLYYIYINAFSDPGLVAAGEIVLYPKNLYFQNFLDIFKIEDLDQAVFNSIARTVLSTIATVFTAMVLGYVMSRPEFKYRKFCYRYFILTMYIGAGLIPAYMNAYELGFLNSFWFIYIIGNFYQAYNLILTKTYIEGLPASLEEAAYIDGAGYFKRFIYVVVPLSKPIIGTIAVFAAVGAWNSYFDTILYMTEGGNQTLQSVLFQYLNEAKMLADIMKSSPNVTQDMLDNLTPVAVKYCITAVTLTPILLVYPFFQKYFTKGIMMGAVKG